MNQKWKRFCIGLCLAVSVILSAMPCFASEKEYKCEVTLPVQIEIIGDQTSAKEMFEVSLTSADVNTPMPEISTKTREGVGDISFGPISYTLPEDYHYVITQKKGTAQNWVYDQTIYEVTVRIVNNEDGELVSEVWVSKSGSNEKCDKIKFTNRYEAPSIPTVPTVTPKTGDSANMGLYVGMAGISMFIVLMVLVICSRQLKRKREA